MEPQQNTPVDNILPRAMPPVPQQSYKIPFLVLSAFVLVTISFLTGIQVGLSQSINVKTSPDFQEPTRSYLPTETLVPTSNSPVPSIHSVSDSITDWSTFTSQDLGISFKYPQELGKLEFNIQNGDTGKQFYGSANNIFAIGGISENYSAGRGGHFFDFLKYTYESGKYYHQFTSSTKILIEPEKITTIDGQKVLLVNSYSYVDSRGKEGPSITPGDAGAALINLPNGGVFKGIAFQNYDKNSLSKEKFEQILSTFKFIDPAANWKTYTEDRELKFTLNYPVSWKIDKKDGMYGSKHASFSGRSDDLSQSGGVSIQWNSEPVEPLCDKQGQSIEKVQIKGRTIDMCHSMGSTQEPEGYVYNDTHNGVRYSIVTANSPGSENKNMVFQILSTLEFN